MESERKPWVEIRVPGNVEKHAICQVCFPSLSPFCSWMLFLPLVSYRHPAQALLMWLFRAARARSCPEECKTATLEGDTLLQKDLGEVLFWLCLLWDSWVITHSGLQLPTGLNYPLGFLVFTINTGCPTSIRVPFHAESNNIDGPSFTSPLPFSFLPPKNTQILDPISQLDPFCLCTLTPPLTPHFWRDLSLFTHLYFKGWLYS